MKKIIALCVLFFFSPHHSISQSVTNLVDGQLKGFTYTPTSHHAFINAGIIHFSTNSGYDSEGKKTTFKDYSNDSVDPELIKTSINLSGLYALNNKFGFSIIVPFIAQYKLKANPSKGYYEEDMLGDTGIGDVKFGAWYLIRNSLRNRILASAEYRTTTGTSPYKIYYEETVNGTEGHNQPFSTGLGYSSYNFALLTDIVVMPKLLLSLRARYNINNEFKEDDYFSEKSKKGNEIHLLSRVLYDLTERFDIGFSINYITAGDGKVDGNKDDNSNFYILSILPQIGFQLLPNSQIISFTLGYSLPLRGKNYLSKDSLLFGTNICF